MQNEAATKIQSMYRGNQGRKKKINKKKLKKLEEIFKTIDKDSSGFIDYKELANFQNLMNKALDKPPPSARQLAQIFSILDYNKDQKISF